MKNIGIIGPGSSGRTAAQEMNSGCSAVVPDFVSECQPDLKTLTPDEGLKKLQESKKSSILVHNGPNRRQRHRAAKSKLPGMMRGTNLTPAKKKRK